MFLLENDAQSIVNEMKQLIHRDINIMDETGLIIASTDPTRIHQKHSGAEKILQEKLPRLIVDSSSNFPGTHDGINLPIQFMHKTVGVIGITGDPKEVEIFGSVIQKMTEITIERSWRQEQKEELERARSLFLENWLFSEDLDASELEVRGKLLGIDAALPRTAAILQIQSSSNDHSAASGDIGNANLLKLVRNHISDDPQNLSAAVHQKILLFLNQNNPKTIRKLLQDIIVKAESFYGMQVCGGIGSSGTYLDLRRCYLEAKTALRVSLHQERHPLAYYGDVSLDFIAQSIDPSVQKNLRRIVFGRCSPEEQAEILSTIRLYFKHNGNTDRAAEEAFIHRNTFLYRVGKVKKQTGYSLRNPQDAVFLCLVSLFTEH